MAIVCHIVCAFHTTVTELSSWDRDQMAFKTKIFTTWLFMETICQPPYWSNQGRFSGVVGS